MSRYRVKAPNGGVYEFTAPDGVSQDDVLAYARQQFAAQSPNTGAPPTAAASYPQSRAPRLSELPLPIRDGAGGVNWMTPDQLGLPADFSHLPRLVDRTQMPASSFAALSIPNAPFNPMQPPSGDGGLLGLLPYSNAEPQYMAGGLLSFPRPGTDQTGLTASALPSEASGEGGVPRSLVGGAASLRSSGGRIQPVRNVPDGK